jgi:hypothetical protein
MISRLVFAEKSSTDEMRVLSGAICQPGGSVIPVQGMKHLGYYVSTLNPLDPGIIVRLQIHWLIETVEV